MPTLSQWETALRTPRNITIESSPALLASVHAKQARHNARLQARGHPLTLAKGPLAVVEQFDPRLTVPLAPVSLLHRLGVITTPVIPNLTDISSTWAHMRYLWAFELPDGTPNDPLRLSSAALDIDFHQKGLMSDQIGVGMAAVVMELYFDAADAVDVAVALDEQVLPVELAGAASPDYLFSNVDGTTYYVVECKGTRCGREVALQQLRRGVEQVPALRFTDGRHAPMALVIGTRLSGAGTEVLVIDPPADEDKPESVTSHRAKERWISDSENFQQNFRMASELKVLAYAGADRSVEGILKRKWPDVAETWSTRPRQTTVMENALGEFSGVEQTLFFPDGMQVDVFQGIGRDVLAGHLEHDDAKVRAERQELLGRFRTRNGDHVRRTENTDKIGALNVSSDGTILDIRLSEA